MYEISIYKLVYEQEKINEIRGTPTLVYTTTVKY